MEKEKQTVKEAQYTEELKAEAARFWAEILAGVAESRHKAIKNELTDYYFILDNVSKVYSHITGGKLSKPNYYAAAVIEVADDERDRQIQEAIEDDREARRLLQDL